MRPAARDEGTVLLLVLGLVLVLFALVAVVVDVSAVVLARRDLDSTADGAAVAAAQQVDEAAVVDRGLGGRLPLDPDGVAGVVATYEADEQPSQPGLRLVPSLAGTDTAVVDATRTVRLPLTAFLGVASTVVHTQGRARSPVVP